MLGEKPSAKPLEGLLVVALEQAVAAPYCSSRLADAGARVIKIERPDGDFARGYDDVVHGDASYFVWLNRGKESVVLNIKQAADAALLRAMLDRADVFVQNLAPGAAERANLDPETLTARNPRLIYGEISGYGPCPDYQDMKAYDLLVQCEAGLAAISGGPGEPGRIGVSVADIAAGMTLHAGLLQALIARGVTGKGAVVRTSLFEAISDWMAVPLLHHDYGGRAPERVGLKHPSIAPYGGFRTADGTVLVVAVQNAREWLAFARDILGDAAFATDPRFATNVARVHNRQALDALIADVFAARTHSEMAQCLRSTGIAFGALNDVAEFSRHPALRRWPGATAAGPMALSPAPPIRAPWDTGRHRPVPKLGEHTAAICREFSPDPQIDGDRS